MGRKFSYFSQKSHVRHSNHKKTMLSGGQRKSLCKKCGRVQYLKNSKKSPDRCGLTQPQQFVAVNRNRKEEYGLPPQFPKMWWNDWLWRCQKFVTSFGSFFKIKHEHQSKDFLRVCGKQTNVIEVVSKIFKFFLKKSAFFWIS